MIENDIAENLLSLKTKINQITLIGQKSNLKSIKLIAVSKTKPISAIQSAFDCEHKDFGENYAPELAIKAEALKNLPINWHFIGQIQSNKTKLIAKYSNWVHSLSSIKIANRFNNHCDVLNKKLNILIQINLLEEKSKSGISLDELDKLVNQIIEMKNLNLRGLMFMPPIDLNKKELKKSFLKIKAINQELQSKYPDQKMDTLSYGMSTDWKIAIQSGSNCIRIGTSIFGER